MSSAQTAIAKQSCSAGSNAEISALKEQVQTLKTQLDWFKRQLFGAKSEKRLEIDPSMPSGDGVTNNASAMTCCPAIRSPRPSNMPWPESPA